MRFGLFFVAVCFLMGRIHAQNLVPNPGFEVLTSCPNNQAQINLAQPWFDPGFCTPDLYNTCVTSGPTTAPFNWFGYQNPHSGDGYAGLGGYGFSPPSSNIDQREFIETPLSEMLIAGKKYCIEFYASLADSSFWFINHLGAYVSAGMINPNCGPMSVSLQAEFPSTQLFTDTMNWVKISGSFVATGGENYLTIGNFYSDSQTDTSGNHGSWIMSYFFIDDVSLVSVADCDAGNDSTICLGDSLQLGTLPDSDIVYSWLPATGLSNASIANPQASPFSTTTYTLTQTQCDVIQTATVTVTVRHDCNTYPKIVVPSMFFGSQQILILGLESGSQLEIYDARGRMVYYAMDYLNDFWTAGLDAGIYFVRLTRPNQQTILQKICVMK